MIACSASPSLPPLLDDSCGGQIMSGGHSQGSISQSQTEGGPVTQGLCKKITGAKGTPKGQPAFLALCEAV